MATSERAPLASVVVVTWNARAMLADCLGALAVQTSTDHELIVVDNGSTDGTPAAVAEAHPDARLVVSPSNLGFVRGANLGMRQARGRYVLLLNNDCLPEPTWLERAVGAAERSRADMVATAQLRADRPGSVDSAGIALDRAGVAWDRGGGATLDALDADGSPPLFGPSGGAALYSRELLADVGLFDPEFGMYYEDVDLAWRARLRGWSCAFACGARALHLGSATAGRNAPRKRFLLGRNKLWTIAKCYPGRDLRRHLAWIVAYDAGALAGYVLAARSDAVGLAARRAAFSGRVAALRGLGRQLHKRRAIQAGRRASDADVLGAMAPIEPPWRAARRFAHLPEGVAL